jgi:pimeloyl-ACP methyl ester carboxylesterase
MAASDTNATMRATDFAAAAKRRNRRRALLLAAVFAVPGIVLASALLNLAIGASQRARYPVPGAFFKVNGVPMHIYCVGTGSPTVLLEGGAGDDWLYWQKVQPEVAKTTRICSYDRAGLGWSDLQPGPRDAKNIAAQLHSLLQDAGETGPMVLVGASAGGFYVREFVADYPAQVAGVVFVDSSVPEQITAFPDRKDSDARRAKRHRDAMWQWIRETSGWARLTGQCTGDEFPGLVAYADLARAEACRPLFAASWLGEADNFWRSAEEAAAARCCGEVPLMVISQDPERPKPGWSAEAIAQQPTWSSLQDHLKSLSLRSRRIIARGSGHHVMIDRPDVVIRGIEQIVTEIRGTGIHPEYGTTVVQ